MRYTCGQCKRPAKTVRDKDHKWVCDSCYFDKPVKSMVELRHGSNTKAKTGI